MRSFSLAVTPASAHILLTMSTPLLIAVIITIFMVAAHIGVFWWFVFRENKKSQASAHDESDGGTKG